MNYIQAPEELINNIEKRIRNSIKKREKMKYGGIAIALSLVVAFAIPNTGFASFVSQQFWSIRQAILHGDVHELNVVLEDEAFHIEILNSVWGTRKLYLYFKDNGGNCDFYQEPLLSAEGETIHYNYVTWDYEEDYVIMEIGDIDESLYQYETLHLNMVLCSEEVSRQADQFLNGTMRQSGKPVAYKIKGDRKALQSSSGINLEKEISISTGTLLIKSIRMTKNNVILDYGFAPEAAKGEIQPFVLPMAYIRKQQGDTVPLHYVRGDLLAVDSLQGDEDFELVIEAGLPAYKVELNIPIEKYAASVIDDIKETIYEEEQTEVAGIAEASYPVEDGGNGVESVSVALPEAEEHLQIDESTLTENESPETMMKQEESSPLEEQPVSGNNPEAEEHLQIDESTLIENESPETLVKQEESSPLEEQPVSGNNPEAEEHLQIDESTLSENESPETMMKQEESSPLEEQPVSGNNLEMIKPDGAKTEPIHNIVPENQSNTEALENPPEADLNDEKAGEAEKNARSIELKEGILVIDSICFNAASTDVECKFFPTDENIVAASVSLDLNGLRTISTYAERRKEKDFILISLMYPSLYYNKPETVKLHLNSLTFTKRYSSKEILTIDNLPKEFQIHHTSGLVESISHIGGCTVFRVKEYAHPQNGEYIIKDVCYEILPENFPIQDEVILFSYDDLNRWGKGIQDFESTEEYYRAKQSLERQLEFEITANVEIPKITIAEEVFIKEIHADFKEIVIDVNQ